MKFSRHIYIVFFSLCVLIAGCVSFGVLPLLGGIQHDARELRVQGIKVQEARSLEGYIDEFVDLSQEKAEEFRAFKEMFDDPETPISFLEFLEDAARESSLNLKIVPGNPTKTKGAA